MTFSGCCSFFTALYTLVYCDRMSSVCLSVCLSVTLVNCDHISWNSSKIISPLVSLGRSLFATPTWRVCSKGNTLKFGPKVPHLRWFERWDIRLQIAAEWLHIAQRSQWRAYRKPPSLFRTVPSLTPYDLPVPQKMRVPYALNIREWPYLCNGWSDLLHVWFQGRVFGDCGSNGAIYDSNKSKMAATAMLENFQMAISPQPVVWPTSCFVLGWGFRGRRIYGAIFDSNKFKMAAAAILDYFEWPYLCNGSRSTYISRIARSYLR